MQSTRDTGAAAGARARRGTSAAVALVLGVSLALGATSLEGPFVLDDVAKIQDNLDLRDLAALSSRLVYPYGDHQVLERNDPSRPVVFLSFALNYAVGGVSPFGYHLVNALLHALNALLVWLLGRQLLGSADDEGADLPWWRARRWLGPVGAALLFACAPVNLGTAAYVYGRSDVLGSTFVLGAVLLYLRRGGWAQVGALLCFALALFSKQSAVALPALLVVADAGVRPARPWRGALGDWRRHGPFLLLALAYVAYRFVYFGAIGDMEAQGKTWPAGEYAAVQPWVLLRYLQLLLVPVGLAIDHQVLPETVSTAERLVGGGALLALVGAGGYALWRRRAPGSLSALGVFALLWFLVAVAPTSSVLPTVDALVERRVYLASVGLVLFVVAAALRVVRRPALRPWLLGAALLPYVAVGLWRHGVHADAERLWRAVLEVYPTSVRATNNLGTVLLEQKRFAEARDLFARLVAWHPGDAIAQNNLGHVLNREDTGFRDVEGARAAFRAAITGSDTYAAPHYNLGRIYQQEGQLAQAEAHYLRVLALQPGYVLAHNNLGLLYFHQGRHAEARARYTEALRLDPTCGPARHNLALLERTEAGAAASPPSFRPPPPGAATSPGSVRGALPGPSPGARPVPVDEVPSALLVRLYEDALAKQPENRPLRRKYADLCRARKLPCAREQYRRLLEGAPGDVELGRLAAE